MGGPIGQGHPQLRSHFKASLGYMRLCLKRQRPEQLWKNLRTCYPYTVVLPDYQQKLFTQGLQKIKLAPKQKSKGSDAKGI